MAESVLGAWWDRLRGRLEPRPCPYSLAPVLEIPGRGLLASPDARALFIVGGRATTVGVVALSFGASF